MFMYFRVAHWLPAIRPSLAAARSRQDLPSENAPTAPVRRLISFIMRSRGLLARILIQ